MYGVLTRRSSIVRFTTLFVEKKRDFDWYSWKCSSAFYASSQHFHSFTFIGRPLEKHAIFAHVLVCIIYVVAEPRRFLAILLIETGWAEIRRKLFRFSTVSQSCGGLFRLRSRKSWLNTSFRSFLLSSSSLPKMYYFSYFMCKERFLMVYLLTCTWGCSQAIEGHAASHYILSNFPQPLHLGSVFVILISFFGSDG